ncbi:Swt1 family HEPN domain-containing protein [Roseateles sp.]|uniref:Swt1 family HEPN domain-containing protein n=1 Tax=Roseateles sp. TaxID=1971397 RepID=UPI00394A5E00
MKAQLSDFMFRGLLAKHAIRDMQAVGQLREPIGSAQERGDIDLLAPVSESVRASSLYMQRCYRLLFVLENVVREFVREVLEEIDSEQWFEKRASRDMKKKVDDRKAAEAKNQWHTGRNAHPIYYLDFGDLALLIQSHWADFKDLLPTQSWAVSRLQDAERSRNVIAHTNVLSDEEVTRLEMHVRDWVRQVR